MNELYNEEDIEEKDRKREKEEKSKVWIVPNNDLEAKSIIEILEKKGEIYYVTSQAWGASWENLEDEIKIKIENARREGKQIYGIELQGQEPGTINIDHHSYDVIYDTGNPIIDEETRQQKKDGQGNPLYKDDRSNNKSSIEQVADILCIELNLDESFISENDKGYIAAMEELGLKLGIGEEDLKEIIANIRMRDREVQGVTPEQELQAEEAVNKLGEIEGKQEYIHVRLPHSKTSTITDRLYGKYDNLLVTSEDGETNFFGKTEIIEMLEEKFPGGWKGGALKHGNGFWGGYPNQKEIISA